MDVVSWLLSRKYCDNSIRGISGVLAGKNATIESANKVDGVTTVVFKWTADDNTVRRTTITVDDGETPAFSSVAITGGHRLTFTTQDPAQSVAFNVMDGAKGDMGISVVASNVDDNNNLTLTLSNGNVINAGKIKAVTTVDSTLSTTSSNPVENKVITNALNNKVDKEMGKGLFSDEEKTKLANIEDGAQVNVLEKLIVNGQEATITDKSIALTLITSAVSNLQNYYLKTETYTKQEVEDLIGSTVGVTIEIVEQLPAEGQSNVIYFLPTETEGVYSQYIYTTDGWILIGSTTVDLSNYYTKAQVDTLLNGKQNVLTIDSFPTVLSNNPVASGGVYTAIAQMQPQFQFANMPTASSSNLGFVYQYTGATGTYTQNMFYRCVYDSELGEYKWVEVIFHATVTVDSAISGTSTNPVQNKVIKEALDTKQDIMQYSTMPSAQDNLGKIVQYIGTNTANYTNGYFYKAVYNSESDVYLWTVIKFSADMLVDNALSTTSENPVQNKVITGAINDIQGVIPSEASSTNQLVDRDSLGTASQKNFTPYVSPDNADVPISSSVYSAITSAVYGAYHPSGSKTIAELTSDLLVLANIGNVYKITEDGVTTNLFVGGAGQTIHTGDNAVVVYGGQPNTFLFDLQSGSIDLTPYQTKALESTIEGATTVEGALGALSTDKQSKDLATTVESATTVEGALGALSNNKQAKTLTTSVESQTTVEGALGALSTNKATQAEVNDIVNVLGAKNLIPFPYSRPSGYSNYGMTCTYDENGVITVNKTADSVTAYFALYNDTLSPNVPIFLEPNKNYILSLELENATDVSCYVNDGNTDIAFLRHVTTGKHEYLFTTPAVLSSLVIGLYWINSATETNAKVKPMIRLASIQDDTYEPYSKTNRKLTIDKAEQAEVNDIVNVLGAKNLMMTSAHTHTQNGITKTVNADGSFTLNGTATNNTYFYWMGQTEFPTENIQYTYSIETSAVWGIGKAIAGIDKRSETAYIDRYKSLFADGTTHIEGTFTGESGYYAWAWIFIPNGTQLTDVIVKGMIRLASVKDNTYEPYVKTNRELTIDKAEQTEVNDIVNVYGAKNLLQYPYYSTTITISGVTITDNGDGTLTLDGTATDRISYDITATASYNLLEIGKKYLIGFKTSDDTIDSNSWALRIYCKKDSTTVLSITDSRGSDVAFTVPEETVGANVQFIIVSGTVLNNVVIKPMIRLASIQDDTWVPYVPTNKELMSCKLNGYVGAKNLIPYPYSETTKTADGITFTDNGDGTVSVSGTTTGNPRFYFQNMADEYSLEAGKAYTLSQGFSASDPSKCKIEVALYNGSTFTGYVYRTNTDDGTVTFTIPTNVVYDRVTVYILISSGAVISTPVTFKPMIRHMEDTDSTWQPYAMTNKQLTDVIPKIVSYDINVTADENGNAAAGLITDRGIPINFKPASGKNYPCIPFIDLGGNIYIRPLNTTWGATDYGTASGINIQGTLYCIKV